MDKSDLNLIIFVKKWGQCISQNFFFKLESFIWTEKMANLRERSSFKSVLINWIGVDTMYKFHVIYITNT